VRAATESSDSGAVRTVKGYACEVDARSVTSAR